MQPSLLKLAKTLDGWSDNGHATLTETQEVVAVNGLSASHAVTLTVICQGLSWIIQVEDGSGSETQPNALVADFEPFRFILTKPVGIAGPGRLVTNTALKIALERGEIAGVMRLVRCDSSFETSTARFSPFDDDASFQPQPNTAKPRRVVRESGAHRLVIDDIGAWLLRDCEQIPWADECFQVWLHFAALNVVRTLANEVEPTCIVFRGPPLVRIPFSPMTITTTNEPEFRALQAAAAWVYDNERELEMRHGLYAAELARTAFGEADAMQALRRFAAPALESARIAYGLNLSQVSRDTLKALADLRKAVSDETSKLADNTRTIATAVTTALFAGVGLLITRSTTNAPGTLLIGLSVIIALYVGAIIWSGRRFIKIQASIRANWRQRLYIFLPNRDYEDMVEIPSRDAEDAFYTAARFGGIISILLVAGVVTFVLSGPIQSLPPAPNVPLQSTSPALHSSATNSLVVSPTALSPSLLKPSDSTLPAAKNPTLTPPHH